MVSCSWRISFSPAPLVGGELAIGLGTGSDGSGASCERFALRLIGGLVHCAPPIYAACRHPKLHR